MKTTLLIFISFLAITQMGYASTTHKSHQNKTVKTTIEKPPTVKVTTDTSDAPLYYGRGLCDMAGYTCIKTKAGDTWQKLWPDPAQRHIVQELNRTDMRIREGTVLAVPDDLANITLRDVAPFPTKIAPMNNKLIMVDQDRLAWAAYDRSGDLVNWGAISSGRDFCPDVGKPCRTMTGEFYVFNKEQKECDSGVFPVGEGGAKMPFCMFFYKGFALHGSYEVIGYRDSHGCVRMFVEDAEWLNHHFVELPAPRNNNLGTKVVIQKLMAPLPIQKQEKTDEE